MTPTKTTTTTISLEGVWGDTLPKPPPESFSESLAFWMGCLSIVFAVLSIPFVVWVWPVIAQVTPVSCVVSYMLARNLIRSLWAIRSMPNLVSKGVTALCLVNFSLLEMAGVLWLIRRSFPTA